MPTKIGLRVIGSLFNKLVCELKEFLRFVAQQMKFPIDIIMRNFTFHDFPHCATVD